MSNIDYINEEKAADIGNFYVGRLLPFRQKKHIGPFVFIDHIKPTRLGAGDNLDVPPHPHIGLSTLTFLMEGAVMHRDSLGTVEEIKPGAVNWMTSGKGVVHSERTPDTLRETEKSLHGLQIWVALPKDKEEMDPSFVHIPAKDIPSWTEGDLDYRLIAGRFGDKKSPVPVYSDLYMIEIKSKTRQKIAIGNQLFGESGLYILEGSVTNQEYTYEKEHILITKDAHLCEFEIGENTTVYIFGGTPFPEERFIYWNFVSSSRARIEKAKTDWHHQDFDKVPGENDFVPLPEDAFKFRNK